MDLSRGRLVATLRHLPGYRVINLLRSLAKGGQRRQSAVAEILRPRNLFQPHGTTSIDRYPEAFTVVRDELGSTEGRLLSFGCSTGEELITLRRYFPAAALHGIDANPLAVRAARSLIRSSGLPGPITVSRGGDAGEEPPGSYDAVFAMAVFRHGSLGSAPPTCSSFVRFADFERTIDQLVACLLPGGLFVIRHANFQFTDCASASGFDRVAPGAETTWVHSNTPVYDRNDRLVPDAARDDGVYRKRL